MVSFILRYMLVIEKNGQQVAVEIETGKSDWRKNMQKNLKHDFQRIIIITTNDNIYRKRKETIEKDQLKQYFEIYHTQEVV